MVDWIRKVLLFICLMLIYWVVDSILFINFFEYFCFGVGINYFIEVLY